MTQKMSEYPTYYVPRSIKMSQENEMCQGIFALAVVGIYSTVSVQFLPPSVQFFFFLRFLTPSAFQSVSFPLNCFTATKHLRNPQ